MDYVQYKAFCDFGWCTLKFIFGLIDFCVESYWVIESSRIKYLQDSRVQDHSHSDTTPLYYIYINIYIYLHMVGHGEKFQGKK